MGAGRWIVSTAVRAGQVSEGLDFAETLGRQAVSSARDAGRGAHGAHRMGLESRRRRADRGRSATEPEPPGVLIGADGGVFHSDDDRGRALADLDVAFARFRAEAEPIATAIAARPATAQWWRVDVLPLLSDWAAFRDHESSWVGRLATEWSTYEAWLAVLRGMRSGARAQGLALASPEPASLPRTMFERAAAGQGTRLEAAWTIGRTLLYTAIGLAGVVGLYTVWRDLRSNGEQAP